MLEGDQSFTVTITSSDPDVNITCSSAVVTIHEDPTESELCGTLHEAMTVHTKHHKCKRHGL